MKRLFCLWLNILTIAGTMCMACTSMMVPASHSATGRPLMWKHRDTGAEGNFVARVEPKGDNLGYTALFNHGDSLLTEAWMGMNDKGFAIMNTMSYNLKPYYKNEDGEGLVMSKALQTCVTVDDFEELLKTLYADGPCQIGVQANFGVMDANSGMAYFETDDYGYERFDIGDQDCMVRTNYSLSQSKDNGKGLVRYDNVVATVCPIAAANEISPLMLINDTSRSFYNAAKGKELLDEKGWIEDDGDCIPRRISTSSIVIEGANSPDQASEMLMWTALGYPPCADLWLVTQQDIPQEVGPSLPGWKSKACVDATELGRKHMKKKSGKNYVNAAKLRKVIENKKRETEERYHAMRNGVRAIEL